MLPFGYYTLLFIWLKHFVRNLDTLTWTKEPVDPSTQQENIWQQQ